MPPRLNSLPCRWNSNRKFYGCILVSTGVPKIAKRVEDDPWPLKKWVKTLNATDEIDALLATAESIKDNPDVDYLGSYSDAPAELVEA